MSLNPSQDSPNEQRGPSSSVSGEGTLSETWLGEEEHSRCLLLLLSFGFKLVSCGNFRFMESCKATIENLHMPLTQTSPMLKFHIMMIYLSKLRTTFVYYYQLNSRLDSGFLRFFSGYSLCMLLTPHILYLIIMPPLSLPIHDCV